MHQVGSSSTHFLCTFRIRLGGHVLLSLDNFNKPVLHLSCPSNTHNNGGHHFKSAFSLPPSFSEGFCDACFVWLKYKWWTKLWKSYSSCIKLEWSIRSIKNKQIWKKKWDSTDASASGLEFVSVNCSHYHSVPSVLTKAQTRFILRLSVNQW